MEESAAAGISKPKRIIFTGGSGQVGRPCISHLVSQGHTVLNLDLVSSAHPSVHTIRTDLTNSGEVYNALSTQLTKEEYGLDSLPPNPDAVIHFAAYPRPRIVPDNALFANNVTSAYNVVEAACKLGIRKIILASSLTVYGICYSQGHRDFDSFPLDEETYDCNPEDPYAISRICMERMARGFAKRFPGVDIYCLRIGYVAEPHNYPAFVENVTRDPESANRSQYSYTDAQDLATLVELCVKKSGLGYQIFNATSNEVTTPVDESTEDFLKRVVPKVPVTRQLVWKEAPASNSKARRILGFRPKHSWSEELIAYRKTGE